MKGALQIFRFLRACAERDEAAVLVTLTDVTGSAVRTPGTHMAVAANGDSRGSFSGGCVEAAVIAEAQDVLASGQARHVRFGAGSPYIDIRLPCGGGIDLLFTPLPDRAVLERAINMLERRTSLLLRLSRDGSITASGAEDTVVTGWEDGDFGARHDPDLRVVILGQGAEPGALLDVARAYGAETLLLSPDAALVERAHEDHYAAHVLKILGRSEWLSVDPWTAVVALFHDHDWDVNLLLQGVDQQPLFIGAMGSRRTHAERRRRLIAAGGDPSVIDRIVGPIGLIDAARDPQTLAISIMAELVQAYQSKVGANTISRPSTNDEKGSRLQ